MLYVKHFYLTILQIMNKKGTLKLLYVKVLTTPQNCNKIEIIQYHIIKSILKEKHDFSNRRLIKFMNEIPIPATTKLYQNYPLVKILVIYLVLKLGIQKKLLRKYIKNVKLRKSVKINN